jgi:glycosyltransferase involved in cell wall biosynthesis
MNTELVSIIIPTFNRENCVIRAIESALKQSYPLIEVVVVDDGSTDRSVDKISLITCNDPRVRVIQHTTNYGQNAALNSGICFCKGQYITFCDSDDVLLPDFVEKFILKFKSDSELGAVYSRKFVKIGNGQLIVANPFYLEGFIYPQVLAQGYLSHMGTIMVKRYCLKKTRLFDINFTNHQDDDFCFLLAKYFKIGILKEALAIEFNEGLSDRVTENRIDYAEGFLRLIKKYSDDITYFAGPDAMINHLNKSVRLFLDVLDVNSASLLLTECINLFNKTMEDGVPPKKSVETIVPSRPLLREQLILNINMFNATLK